MAHTYINPRGRYDTRRRFLRARARHPFCWPLSSSSSGTITLSYLTLTTTDGIVGLSDGGGLEEFFVPVDFTSCHYSTGACGAVRDACVTQPGGVAIAGDGGGLDEQQQGALSAIEGVEVVGFLLQIGTFLLAALLAWPTLRPLVLGGNGYGGNGAAGAAAMGGGSVQIGAPPRGTATGGYSVMSENAGCVCVGARQ